MNNEQAVAKAERFHRWYEEDGLKDALQAIRQGYIDGMINTGAKDNEAREKYYTAIRSMDNIEGHILSVIGGGKIADRELKRIEKEYSQSNIFNLRK
tara:strand:- start:31184 stop:31474 length:291 start_codon:yes stop_codon:yes gene_type:complete